MLPKQTFAENPGSATVPVTVPVAVAGVSPATFEPDVLGETPNTAGGDARAPQAEGRKSSWAAYPYVG